MSQKSSHIFAIGEVLFDAFPDQERLGGAPFNFIYHLHHLGFQTNFLTRIGQDEHAQKILDFLKKNTMSLDFIQNDNHHHTGLVDIEMKPNHSHTFHILPDRAYDYIEYPYKSIEAPSFKPELIYFGTLAQREAQTQKTIYEILNVKKSSSLVFLDINLRAPFFNKEVIQKSLTYCDILKINNEELVEWQAMNPNLPKDETACISKIMQNYKINTACLTKGAQGSRLFYQGKVFEKKLGTNLKVADSVGAGDGFASILAMGILLKWPGEKILDRASTFAMNICKISGAIPENPSFYQDFLTK